MGGWMHNIGAAVKRKEETQKLEDKHTHEHASLALLASAAYDSKKEDDGDGSSLLPCDEVVLQEQPSTILKTTVSLKHENINKQVFPSPLSAVIIIDSDEEDDQD
ncbi:hypothetical protein RIF29_37909 [Crotalaria pallida]|uniref:Uncharacterized protein n=1 Tax=Crotalaria pallida TaxID=3830 RepID=A0AAN9HRU3_CROPI